MNSHALSQLYKNLSSHYGKAEARNFIGVILSNIISRIEDQGQTVNAENLEHGILEAVEDYKTRSKEDVA